MSEGDLGFWVGTFLTLLAAAAAHALGMFGWPVIVGFALGSAVGAWFDHRKWKRGES